MASPGRTDNPEREPLIVVRKLSRTYAMGTHEVRALHNVDISINDGEFVAIVGPSGSGKSTLMYILGCLDTPTDGSYRLAGEEISQLGDARLSQVRNREIGFVFQQFYLLPDLDVTDNAAIGMTYAGVPRPQRRTIASGIATRMGLGDRLRHTPTELSGGQTQRVAIARALTMSPRLILADEPTGNLDSQTGAEIMQQFRALHAQGRTIILVTHDQSLADQTDRIIRLVDGEVVSDETRQPPPASKQPEGERPAAEGSGRLGFRDIVRIAFREGLLAHKLRSLLTMLGIIFGIAAVIIMTSITEGGKQRQLEQLRQVGLRNIFVQDAKLQGAALLRERRVNPQGVCREDMQQISAHLDGIAGITAWKTLRTELQHAGYVIEEANTLGVLGDFQHVANYNVELGRFLNEQDQESYSRVCVIGPEIAQELNLGDNPIEASILIGDQPFDVVGVMERKAFAKSDISDISIENRNRDVYVPYQSLRSYFRQDPKGSELDTIAITMASEEGLVEKSERVQNMVHHLHFESPDFNVSVPLEKLRQARRTEETFNLIIIVISGISLIVGGIGIMNIMLATVTERTREIGIRRALGASRRNIMWQFLMEALLIALSGGALGILCGIVGGALVQVALGFSVAFSTGIVIVSVLVSTLVGITFGMYPAWMAANMDPVDALRN